VIAGVKRFLDGVTKWASQRETILAVALVGSQARGTASACSDVDLIILTQDARPFLADTAWLEEFGHPVRQESEQHGNLLVLRVWYQHGLEVEFGFADEAWPADAGGQAAMADGIRVLMDRGPLKEHRAWRGNAETPTSEAR
jgi:predicted nucleotidyltransferase